MQHYFIVSKISVLFFFSTCISFGQNASYDTTAFYNYLEAKKFPYEKLALNNRLLKLYSNSSIKRDSLLLDRVFLHMEIGFPDSNKFFLGMISSTPSFSLEKQSVYASMLLINNNQSKLEECLIGKYSYPNLYYNDLTISYKILRRELNIKDSLFDRMLMSPSIFEIKTRYQNFDDRSPFLAGMYSAILPGAGKLYLGHKNQAITSFISNALLAAQAVESYYRAGVKSPRFIITSGLFSVFYAGNIWGSIAGAKKRKRDFYKQIDHEIYNFHTKYIYSHMY